MDSQSLILRKNNMEIDQATLRKIEANNELARLGFGSDDDVSRAPLPINIPQQFKPTIRKNLTNENSITTNIPPVSVKPPEELNSVIHVEPPTTPTIVTNILATNTTTTNVNTEPKIYSVNGSKIKVMPDGKIFTEQWIEITPDSEDYSKIRILSEKNKKPISLTGKIIQMLKWVEAKEPNE